MGWFVESRLVPLIYRGRPFLTVSEASAGDLAAIGIDACDITVVRNGIAQVPPVGPLNEAPAPRLAVLSRLVPHKQIEHTFALLARLTQELPDLHLDIIGDGWWREELVAEADRMDVMTRVTFHGHVTRPRRDELIGQAWVMLMPSIKEGWCLAITEAGAQGTPSVAYASAGGVAESITDGVTGRLVRDLDDMVEAVRGLLTDPVTRSAMGSAAREKATTLTWEACATRVEDVCRTAMGPDA